jgi:hypothetical protein
MKRNLILITFAQVTTKEGKPYDMYSAKGILPKLLDDRSQSPPLAFVRRLSDLLPEESARFSGVPAEPISVMKNISPSPPEA